MKKNNILGFLCFIIVDLYVKRLKTKGKKVNFVQHLQNEQPQKLKSRFMRVHENLCKDLKFSFNIVLKFVQVN